MAAALAGCATQDRTDMDAAMADHLRASVSAEPTPVPGTKNFFEATETSGRRCAGSETLYELSVAEFNNSNRDASSSVAMLSTMGYSVLSPEMSGGMISCQQLPAILSPARFSLVPEIQPLEATIDQVVDLATPGGWTGLPAGWEAPEAAMDYPGNGLNYLFKGKQYLALRGTTLEPGYTRDFPGGFVGMPAHFASGIDAANYRGDHIIMIKGDEYIRFTGTRMDSGYPKKMGQWPEKQFSRRKPSRAVKGLR